MKNKSMRSDRAAAVRFMTYAGMTAALYVLFTELSALLGLSGGVIQLRFSEALTVLPALLPGAGGIAAGVGLFTGCLIANAVTGCALWDVIFGSLATLLGAAGTLLVRRHRRVIWLPPVISNMLIVPPVLIRVYGAEDALWFLMLTVGAGEALSCGVLGMLLCRALERRGLTGNKEKSAAHDAPSHSSTKNGAGKEVHKP